MIVLHGIWDSTAAGVLHLWAESSQLAGHKSARSRRAGTQTIERHPLALVPEELRETLVELAGGMSLAEVGAGAYTLRLPSTTRGPLPSPELLLESTLDARGLTFRWWSIDTLQLDASHALDLLLALPSNPAHGIAFGSSLRFWGEAANFSFELITRQCFMPMLREARRGGSATCQASWEAVLSPEDAQRVHVLARAMPPVCWSSLPPGEKKETLLQEIAEDFLNRTIDAFVRESLSSTSPLPVKRNKRRTASLSLPERWLKALSSDDPTLTVSPAELNGFADTLHSWLDQARPAAVDAPFRTCFKLDAPEDEGEDRTAWQISFHLQANDDPSLLIPAEKVWRVRSSSMTFLKRKFENPQERLLADLGRASRLFPAIEASLKATRPQALPLNTEQAYTFLRETAPLLEESGFGVLVPPWWQKRSARVGVKLTVAPKVGVVANAGLMGLNSIVCYDWSVAIGDQTLTLEEFKNLVNLKLPLIKVRGQWVELRPEEIEAAIAFFQKKQEKQEMTLGEAMRIGLGQQTSALGLPVLDLEFEGWIKEALAKLEQPGSLAPIEIPATLRGQLRPYQVKGVSWLAFLKQLGFGSCLADSMGLGKTIQLIALLLHERASAAKEQATPSPGPTLLICPMSIVGNWQKEVQRFAPTLSVMIHHGSERLSDQAFIGAARQHDIVITTYSLALRDKAHLAEVEWENIVVDEAQNIKNETARQTQAIKSLNARHKIALTGTPVENRLSELWSIMEFLNPGYLGSGSEFRKTFALPIERYHNAARADTLKRLIQPFVLRRLKTDKTIIRDLPDKMEMSVFCNLTKEQASLYQAVVQEMVAQIEEAENEGEAMSRRGLVLAALLRLKQVCNHPAQYMSDGSSLAHRSGKLARLEEMLEEVLAVGEKALIFTQFAEMGQLLRQYLQETLGCEVLFLHGGVAKKQRDLLVQRFQEEHRAAPLFILSLKAGGVGLNLTAANHVFHFDRWWNPAVEDQATDRAFRIGQRKNVQVHKFVCVGTLEERIDQMIEQKKALTEGIIGSGERWLTELSTAQLKQLFTLGRGAIGED